MGLVVFIIIGFVVGLLVRALTPEDAAGGVVFTVVIGIVGALAGGVLAGGFAGADPLTEAFNLILLGGALAGAIVLLAVYLLITEQ